METWLNAWRQVHPDPSWATRSATVGTPSVLVPYAFFGISTARTGGGKYVSEDIRFHSFKRYALVVLFEMLRATPVDASTSLVCLDLLVGVLDDPFGDHKRLLLQL